MEKTIEELREEADSLGITYNDRIGAPKLQAKIDDYYESIDTDGKDKVVAEVKIDEVTEAPVNEDPRAAALRIIKQQEKQAKETAVVKITMVDKREASTATHAYFSSGGMSLNVPLDVFVEMPKLLIRQAERAKALVHVDVKGRTVHKNVKKYVVEYKK